MDELTLLRSTRDDVAPPSAAVLHQGRARLLERAGGATAAVRISLPRRHPLPRTRWVLAGLAAAGAGTLVLGTVTMSTESAEAAGILRAAADGAVTFADPQPGPGEYLRARTHASWGVYGSSGDATEFLGMNEQVIDVYRPADADAEWVLHRDWGRMTGDDGERIETVRARDGDFYGPEGWIGTDLADIPPDGAEAYAWIDAQYSGGSASRAEDDFGRITTILGSGLVPADTRAALLDALARVPGVTSTAGVTNLDGVAGIAIGRTELLRMGERQEIIIDPATGLVIGERTVQTMAAFGFGVNEVTGHTAIETTVVTEAP